jgi:uncharacterized protein with von Willebrand factor type A (vWA) domain
MDDHIERTEELFSAAKSEFKHMEFFYFHNCVYDYLWKNNRRRHASASRPGTCCASTRRTPPDLRRRRHHEPYEVLAPGGSVEYNNEEAGAEWLARFCGAPFPNSPG